MLKTQIKIICDNILKKLHNKPIDYRIRISKNIYEISLNEYGLACTRFQQNVGITLHLGYHFNLLSKSQKIFVLKHECCHIANLAIEDVYTILNDDCTGHGKTFRQLCNKLNIEHITRLDITNITNFPKFKFKPFQNIIICKDLKCN